MFWIILTAILISIGCYFVWDWANSNLFTYLGEADVYGVIEQCYTYDLLSVPARIVCFLCGVAAIILFQLTWFGIFAIIIL